MRPQRPQAGTAPGEGIIQVHLQGRAMLLDHYDVIGSVPGGPADHCLAPTDKRILMLERGGYLPRSRDSWDAKTVFVDGRYQCTDTWYGADGSSLNLELHYDVDVNSEVYGAALLRLADRIKARPGA